MERRDHRTRTDPRRATGSPRRAVGPAVALVLVLGGLGACSAGGDERGSDTTAAKADRTTTTKATTTTADPTVDPDREPGECPTTTEVAELVGGPVDRSQSLGGNVSVSLGGDSVAYSYEGCSYELTEGGQGEVGVDRISTEDDLGGATLYERLESVARDDAEGDGFTQLDDLGDDAYRDGAKAVVRTAGAMTFVSYDDPEGEEAFDPARTVAEAVLALDLGSAEQPDCDAIEAAAEDAIGEVDRTIPSGGFIGVNDVSLTTRGCSVTFADGAEVDVAVTDPGQWDEWVAAKGDSMFTATFEEVTLGEQRAFDDGEVLIVDDGDQPLRVSADGDDLDPDPAEIRLALAELTLFGA